MSIKRNIFLIATLTIIGVVLHFYNLNWGTPFYFHPDERNIASAVSQLKFPNQLHPHFFAYGSLPIYLIYVTGMIITKLQSNSVPFELAIQISRFYSALFATILIPILFLIGKKLLNEKAGIIAAFLATTSVGFIQFSHFGTFEMWLTFFGTLLFLVCISLPKKTDKRSVLALGFLCGILIAIKISSLIFIPFIVVLLVLREWFTKKHITLLRFSLRIIHIVLLFLTSGFLLYYLTNPFVFLDTKGFVGTMNYETSLAIGTLRVFYTGEFFNTIPVLFHITNVFPFLVNPLVTVVFLFSFLFLVWKMIKTKNHSSLLLILFFLILFLSQAFLFVKWTRYMVPTLPFIYIIVAVTLVDFLKNKHQQFNNGIILTIVIISSLFSFSYFVTAFVRPDTRIEASHFAQKIIPENAIVLSEIYDMGIVPFNDLNASISLFNFYDLDYQSIDMTVANLMQKLESTDYIILPSQRILQSRLLNSQQFPIGNSIYSNLLAGKLGYTKIYQTPCDIFCKITYLGDPVFRFEQTTSVFDRPTVMIFKKN